MSIESARETFANATKRLEEARRAGDPQLIARAQDKVDAARRALAQLGGIENVRVHLMADGPTRGPKKKSPPPAAPAPVPAPMAPPVAPAADAPFDARLEQTILQAIARLKFEGKRCCARASPDGGYLPAIIMERGWSGEFTRREIFAELKRLMAEGRVVHAFFARKGSGGQGGTVFTLAVRAAPLTVATMERIVMRGLAKLEAQKIYSAPLRLSALMVQREVCGDLDRLEVHRTLRSLLKKGEIVRAFGKGRHVVLRIAGEEGVRLAPIIQPSRFRSMPASEIERTIVQALKDFGARRLPVKRKCLAAMMRRRGMCSGVFPSLIGQALGRMLERGQVVSIARQRAGRSVSAGNCFIELPADKSAANT
jgi:hypothetical protein